MDRTSTDEELPPPRIDADTERVALVERDQAWKLAAHAIGGARAGRPSVLLIEAPPGLGKTGLLGAIRSLAVESGVSVFGATGRRTESELGFGVVVQLLESATAEDGPDAAPLWLSRLTEPVGSLRELYPLYRFFRESAAMSPIAVIVDDLDLADEPSVRLLLFLVERLAGLPLAVIAACGNVPLRRAPSPMLDLLRHPLTTRFRLDPLTERGTARRLAKTWLPGTVDELAREVYRATNGNAFLVDKLGAAVAARNGDATPVERLAPPGVADWAKSHAAALDPRAETLLDAIAIFGNDCELRHAAALAGMDATAAGELADELAEAGLLRNGERLSFGHPVVARALTAALPSRARGLRHLEAARLLAAEGAPPEPVAEHLLQATRIGSESSVAVLRSAAAAALRRAAPWNAVIYLRRALDEPPTHGERAEITLDLGRAEAMAGEPQAAVRLRQAAESLSEAPEQPRAALTTGRTLFALGRPDQALAVFERGLANTADADPGLVEQLRASHAIAAWITGFPDLGNGLVAAPSSADTPAHRSLLALHALDGALRSRPCADVRSLAMRALDGGALLQDETADAVGYYLAVAALALAEDFDAAEAALAAASQDARSRGSVLGLATASQWRATVLVRRGSIGAAAVEAGRALVFADYGWRFGLSKAREVLAATHIERGDLDAAHRELDSAEETSVARDPFRISMLDTRGRLLLASGEPAQALEVFLACGALTEGAEVTNPSLVAWRSHAALALAATGDASEARGLAEAELESAKAFGAPGPVGRALRVLASIGEPGLAAETLEEAVEVLEGSQAELDYAAALVDLGAALRRSGRRGAAKGPLMRGLELAERCEAEVLATRARNEMRLSGARPRRTALRGTEALTAREREVAELAAEGMSNRRIAETLVVTMKTVEWHLANCYKKLDVRSRHELRDTLLPQESSPAVG